MSSSSPSPESVAFERLFPARRRELQGPMSLVAFLNVAFLLVLLQWTHAPFVRQAGVRVELPVAEATESLPFDAVVVTVMQEGLVYFRDQRTTMEGLEASLNQAVREQKTRMILDADGRVPHRILVDIYRMAARAGIQQVLLSTQPPPAPATGAGSAAKLVTEEK